jgi:hypothetical protein
MHWVGFEPTILVFERAKMVHALDRAATVIGYVQLESVIITPWDIEGGKSEVPASHPVSSPQLQVTSAEFAWCSEWLI